MFAERKKEDSFISVEMLEGVLTFKADAVMTTAMAAVLLLIGFWIKVKVKDKYGMSCKAFMIVPIVGAFLVDIIYQPQTIAFIKSFVAGFNG